MGIGRERDREAEREAREQRKAEKERERQKERERSLREESLDGMFILLLFSFPLRCPSREWIRAHEGLIWYPYLNSI